MFLGKSPVVDGSPPFSMVNSPFLVLPGLPEIGQGHVGEMPMLPYSAMTSQLDGVDPYS